MTLNNADSLILADESKKLSLEQPKAEENVKNAEEVSQNNEPVEEPSSKGEEEGKGGEEAAAEQKPKEDGKDLYGNEIENKQKMYSEEEVQRMIRDRLSRGRYAEQNQQQQPQQQKVEGEDGWEVQLEDFIDKTIQKREEKRRSEQWKKQEEMTQADFEIKFSQGMSRYKDFRDVVSNKPITDSMMLATRALDDPAGFIYAASKTQAKELERIANIPDSYKQSVEIGRLEERMRRAKGITSAPAPSSKEVGDATDDRPKQSIDQLIMIDAKRKISNR